MDTILQPDDPYCRVCGYQLRGLVDVSRCPECGRPIVEVLIRGTFYGRRKPIRYQSERCLFGVPWVSVAKGANPGERAGHARGIIAVGDIATGVLAFGGLARGVVAIGGCSVGVITIGGCAAGAVAIGSVAVGFVAIGALAIGVVSVGSCAVYLVKGVGVTRLRLWPF